MLRGLTVLGTLLCAGLAAAEVKTKKVEYKFDGVTFIGHLYYDDAMKDKRPGVLVVHEWWGLDDYAKMRAEMLAKMGYVAFACDMYGDGKVAEHPKEATEMVGLVRKNKDVWRGRAKAALKELTSFEYTDGTRLAGIGYCFGGTTCLELAATRADLKAVVTFHSALPKLKEEEAKAIKAKVQVNHGTDDKFISADTITAFKKSMTDAHVSLDFKEYPGAVHSFTVKGAEDHKLEGMKYNQEADEKSWKAMKTLFDEVFKK
jgi:dienelactone hydrolase